jgi:ribonuclease VapC
MIVDTSALIAILRDEPEARDFAIAIAVADRRRISAANYLETAIVIDGSRDPIASRRFDDLLREAEIAVEPVTAEQARVAREAYRDFGRGSGHAARLNFGSLSVAPGTTTPASNSCRASETSTRSLIPTAAP